jgi:hypothetical protein
MRRARWRVEVAIAGALLLLAGCGQRVPNEARLVGNESHALDGTWVWSNGFETESFAIDGSRIEACSGSPVSQYRAVVPASFDGAMLLVRWKPEDDPLAYRLSRAGSDRFLVPYGDERPMPAEGDHDGLVEHGLQHRDSAPPEATQP